jgi:4-aminobutyrate aminotransferase-like enzyme/Ser/Thr protein kinase RdoA (MazF antagonist)
MGSSQRDPLATPAPHLDQRALRDVAERAFGITGSVLPLRSERDQNVRIEAADGGGYLLKVSNPADDRSVVEMQTMAMEHVVHQDPALPVMRIVPASDGRAWVEAGGPDGEPLLVRMFTFLPGRMVPSKELDAEALRGFGAMVARMGLALRGFFHPAAGYPILWDLKRTPRLRPFLDSVPDPRRRALAERLIDRFDERVAPALAGLRCQVIHNDLTIDNVLLDRDHRVSGIVDFGDLTHTALVCDLAVALASLVWEQPDPFGAAEAAVRGYLDVAALEDQEAALLGDLVAARMTAWGVIAAWRGAEHPENVEYITAGDDLAWDLLARFDAMGLDEVARRFEDACSRAALPYRPAPTDDLLRRRRAVLRRSPLTYERPVHLVRGQGVWLFDPDGRRYLDAYNNVPVVGHGHPRVAEAIARQARRLNTNTRYLHEPAVELAERLVSTMPRGLDAVLFVNSGSEANDLAWRLARAATGRRGAAVTEWAYHGLTEATAAMSPEEWAAGDRPEHVELLPPPDGYRGPHRREAGWSDRYVQLARQAIARLAERGMPLAAAVIDPALTSDGILLPPPEYLGGLAEVVRAAGGLLVADEVQAGHGRYGTGLWSFQAAGIEPDIVTLGKPMGNGHPVAAVVTRSEIVESLPPELEPFSTFGGNPVSCAAALAVLDVIEEEALVARAAEIGSYLRDRLRALAGEVPAVGEVRGQGLMVGVDLVGDPNTREPAREDARAAMNGMRDRGILIGRTGPSENVLKIRPPLVFAREHADLLVETLEETLLAATSPGSARRTGAPVAPSTPAGRRTAGRTPGRRRP